MEAARTSDSCPLELTPRVRYTRAMRWFLLSGLLFACGGPTLGGPCSKSCDCTETTKPLSCAGEWVCNPGSTCEFTCKASCSGQVYTCPGVNDTCLGGICSDRKNCPP